jgi:dihydroorotate dehydrogenase
MGLHFPNPVGLAAGFDRDGKLLCYSESAGFGYVEIGTINVDSEKKPDDKIINIVKNLDKASKQNNDTNKQLWGISLGSLRNTMDDSTTSDYAEGMEHFWNNADFFVINLSRPDSPARVLKLDMKELDKLLTNIKQQHNKLTVCKGNKVSIVIKIAVEYSNNEQITNIIQLARDLGFDGVIMAFEGWSNVNEISRCIREFKAVIDSFPFIVVGGIRSTKDAKQILDAGASLVQIYTYLVDRGPLQTRKMIARLGQVKEDI